MGLNFSGCDRKYCEAYIGTERIKLTSFLHLRDTARKYKYSSFLEADYTAYDRLKKRVVISLLYWSFQRKQSIFHGSTWFILVESNVPQSYLFFFSCNYIQQYFLKLMLEAGNFTTGRNLFVILEKLFHIAWFLKGTLLYNCSVYTLSTVLVDVIFRICSSQANYIT